MRYRPSRFQFFKLYNIMQSWLHLMTQINFFPERCYANAHFGANSWLLSLLFTALYSAKIWTLSIDCDLDLWPKYFFRTCYTNHTIYQKTRLPPTRMTLEISRTQIWLQTDTHTNRLTYIEFFFKKFPWNNDYNNRIENAAR